MDIREEELQSIAFKAADLGKEIFENNGYNSVSWIALLLGLGDEEKAIVISPEGCPPGYLYEVIQEICVKVPFDVKGICLIMDTFTLDSKGLDPEEAKRERAALRAGDLSRRFAECDPLVKEALSVCVMSDAGTQMVSIPYIYTPVDGWEWREPTEMPEDGHLDWEFERVIAGLPKRNIEDIERDQ